MRTIKDLERYLHKNNLAQLSIVMIGLEKRNLRLDIIGLGFMFNYHFTYQKNHRGVPYFHYEDWIYTEEEFTLKVLDEISLVIRTN